MRSLLQDHPRVLEAAFGVVLSLLRPLRCWLRPSGRAERLFILGERVLGTRISFFLDAAAHPFVPLYESQAQRLAKKVEAGAQFVQTQFVFDLQRMEQFMTVVRDVST